MNVHMHLKSRCITISALMIVGFWHPLNRVSSCIHGAFDGTKKEAETSCPTSTFFSLHLWASLILFFFYFLLLHFLFDDSTLIETFGEEPYFVHFLLNLYLLGCLPALHGVHEYVQFHTLLNPGRNIWISLQCNFPIDHLYQSI